MKKRKCMADGGMVLAADEKRETVEQMLARMNAKYGTGIPSPAPQPQAPAPQPQAPAQQQTGIVDSLRRRNEELKKAANYARGGVKRMEAGGIAGLPDNLIGGPRYDSPRGAFVWEDGTRRDGLTEQQGAQLDAEIAMNKARADAGIAQNAGASAAPVQTMAEQQIAAGINPNAMYSPGSAADPHASGGMAATAAQKLAYHVMQAQPAINPFDPMAQNRRRKPIAFADGGLIPVNIGHGLYQAIAQPIAEDFRQGARAIKAVRDQYPTADNLAGIHPGIAAAQVANDVLAGNVGGDTAMNVAQAVPMVKGLSGMAKLLSKQAGPTVGDVKLVIDMPSTVRKNTVLTGAQAIGQPENAFADGGMVRFAGKGGPRDDKIPVKVAGEQIRVSDGESAVILPAKTAANPAAVQAIGQIIQATNDGRAPNMGAAVDADRNGMACGGVAGKRKMARGGVIDPEEEKQRNGRPPPTAQEVYGPAYEGIGGALTYLNRGDPLRDAAAGIGSFFRESANQARGGDYGAEHYGVPSNPPAPTQSQVRAVDNSDASRAGIIQYLRDNPGNPASKPSISDNPVGAARADLKNTQNALAAAQGQLSAERFAQTTGNAGRVDYEKGGNGIRWNAGRNYDPTTGDFAPGTGVATVTGAAANGGVTMPGVQQNALGTSIAIGPGRYTAADGTETSDWTKTQDYADAQQRHQNNLAELARIQAGRHGRDPVQSLADLARIPMAQQAAKLESEKGALGNRLAGQQLSIGDINLRQQQALQALYAAHQAAKTPEQAAAIAEQIRVMTLKDRPSHWKPVITHGAKTLEGSEPDSGYLVHEQTGEVRPLKMGQENIPPIPKDKASLKVGQVYRMADGRIGTWIGNGFRPQ